MSSPAVVIEIPAADETSPYAPILVTACSEGLRGGGQCALAASKSEASPAVAVVAWNDDGHLQVRVEVGVRHGARSEWLTRQMTFRASDAEIERWRAVGLVIATLVGEVASEPVAKPPPPPIAPPVSIVTPPQNPIPAFSQGPSDGRSISDSTLHVALPISWPRAEDRSGRAVASGPVSSF